MSTIHFIGGEKGGVGKSVLSRLMSQYSLENALAFNGFDADQSHATLSRFYPDFTQPVDLDVFESTDKIMELALETDGHVIVDLPAQSERFLDRWIGENDVLDMCEEMKVSIVYWYVVDDGLDSANLLDNFLHKYNNSLDFVVVKNQGRGGNFSAIDSVLEKHTGSTKKINLQQAVLPGLHQETMRKIDKLSFSFWGASNIKGNGIMHLSLMERQRTKVWLKKSYHMMDCIFKAVKK
ncbi:mobilization protein MobD [Neptunomonas qingdaonensis]|uniref:CobQ/CobB/MinD/ParA nucleotide binding domain-containing protein n=1 Tax=Neptunomonas qingdaonensis TaxID=1045558 RepID=A0A1I2RJP7_9GAMM|nr:mobilization protein MobD [Neptunomonas qingdaonensis]SFG38061.1 hypothetical protein SAMN05216175_10650 [Neptunomonas qingdaonensis]